jgi:DNA-binding NtrC family response regulator
MNRLPFAISEESVAEEAQQQPIADAASLPGASDGSEEPIVSLRSVRARVEIEAIRSALKRTGWNRKHAARLLRISYRGLLYKIRRHNITAAQRSAACALTEGNGTQPRGDLRDRRDQR